jgi:hypothetical protein
MMTETHEKIIKKVVMPSMMTITHEKIMKMVIITSMMTETHKKLMKNGHHTIDVYVAIKENCYFFQKMKLSISISVEKE